jgi:hypothetical protein
MMGQMTEVAPNEMMSAAGFKADEIDSENKPQNATVCVYGYGPTKNPFYEEAQILGANCEGGLFILSAPVNCGQKLLLINGSGQDPVEAQIVNTRTLGAQMFEVQVAFPFPQPDFWQPLRGAAKNKKKSATEKRRHPRMSLPRGMSIAWEAKERRDISRITSISLGGLFIESADPAPVGEALKVQFDIPGGAVHADAIVRRSIKGKGMGVEFTEVPAGARAGLQNLLQKLLGDVRIGR